MFSTFGKALNDGPDAMAWSAVPISAAAAAVFATLESNTTK